MKLRRLFFLAAGLSILGLGYQAASTAAPAGKVFLAGAHLVDVSPTNFPVVVNAMFTERTGTNTADRLHVRALVLDDGSTRLAIAVVDTCMMGRDLIDRAKALASATTGIPVERMLVSATHTHSAPSAMACLGSRQDTNYAAYLAPRIAEAIQGANERLAPAKLGWTAVDDWHHTFNRSWIRRSDKILKDPFGNPTIRANMHPGHESPDVTGPSGTVDPGLSIVSVQTPAGAPVAVLANYSQHYYGSPLLSADYYGRFAQHLAGMLDATNGNFVPIISQGTSGDLMWMDYATARKDIGYDAYGKELAARAHAALQTIRYQAWVPLKMAERKLPLNYRAPDAARLAWAKQVAAGITNPVPRTQPEIYALEALYLHERPRTELILQAVRIGEVGIAAIPNEVYALTGLKIKAQSPLATTFNIELANGAEGYIPPPEQHVLGGYTTWAARSAGLEVQAEPRIVETALSLLEEVAGKPRRAVTDTSGPYAKAVLGAKPAAYWRLNEMAMPTARDASGNRRDATFEDGVAFYLPGPGSGSGFLPSPELTPGNFSGAGQINRAVHFAGGRMKAAVPNVGRSYSVEFWFWNGFPTNARAITGYLFSRGQEGDAQAAGDHLGIGGTYERTLPGRLFFFNGNALNAVLPGKTELAVRTWHHVALVREGEQVAVYLDGELEISGVAASNLPAGAEWFLGGRCDKLANFEGKLDEVAVYGRALKATEVEKHFQAAGVKVVAQSNTPTGYQLSAQGCDEGATLGGREFVGSTLKGLEPAERNTIIQVVKIANDGSHMPSPKAESRNPFRVGIDSTPLPRVASQPWAGGRNPFGILAAAAAAAPAVPAAVTPKSPPPFDSPALSPAESMKLIKLRKGFEIELVAAEPLLESPVAIDWDDQGRLWVVEMVDYPMGMDGKGQPGGRVRILTDTDGDGRYDRTTLVADGLRFPTGILTWRGGALVTAAPEIIFIKDAGDGKAWTQQVLYTGFMEGNQQLRVNSLRWGLDNWVYCANGAHTGAYGVATRIKSTLTGNQIALGSRDFRFKPDTGELDLQSGPSQFGRNPDNWGNWFGVQNSWPLWHYVLQDHYIRRNPHVPAPDPVQQVLGPKNPQVFPAGKLEKRFHSFGESGHFTSACAAMIYRDELLFGPTPSVMHSFTCEPFHNLVHHGVIDEEGVSFKGHRAAEEQKSEFFASADRWTRPVMTRTGPDGALWVVDMYRYMIEHPEWLPPEGRAELMPHYRGGEDRGRIYRIFPAGKRPPMPRTLGPLAVPQLVAALDSSNGWQRDKAQQMLVWKQDSAAVPLLETLAGATNPFARLHALCTLDGLGALKPELVERALDDASPGVRINALRLAEPRATPGLIGAAVKLAGDHDVKVRLQLACTLGEWNDPRAGQALGTLAINAHDNKFKLAAVMSSAVPHIDALVNAAVAADGIALANLSEPLLNLALALNKRDSVARLLQPAFVPGASGHAPQQMKVFSRFLDALARRKTNWTALKNGPAGDPLANVLQGAPRLFAAATAVAGDTKRDDTDRITALALLVRDAEHKGNAVQALGAWLTPKISGEIQRAAVKTLGLSGDDAVPALLLKNWTALGPETQAAVLDELLGREPWAFALVQQLQAGTINPAILDATRRNRLVRHPSARVKEMAAKVLNAGAATSRAKVVEDFRPALALTGDAARGAAVHAKLCAVCHKLGDTGNDIGPNLQSVVAHPPEKLLVSILDPNASIEPGYLAYSCTLTGGEELYGIIAAETGNSLVLKMATGQTRTILRSDIVSLRSSTLSLMPEGLEAGMTRQELADLIGFLRRAGN
jgi:putative membrane-bound dehydrogenase-like protein